VKQSDRTIRVECDLAASLPVVPDEVRLLEELLPDLLKEMILAQPDEE
jgi:hypothetical protein